MGNYVDSKELERRWFKWAMASNTPCLEPVRSKGVLYSRVSPVEILSHGANSCNDPWLDRRDHFVLLADNTEIFFSSDKGVVNTDIDLNTADIVRPDQDTHDRLVKNGYYLEISTNEIWQELFNDISTMCTHIARKFNLSQETREDMVHDSIMSIMDKIKSHKLIYKPGKAPVFNYLTTSIHRCMYNFLRKDNRYNTTVYIIQGKLELGKIDATLRSYKNAGELL